MAFDAHKNFAYSVVTVAPSPANTGTSLTVQDPGLFPAVPFQAVVWPAGEFPLTTNTTIVRVTNVVGSVFTIVRDVEGSSSRSILVGDQIQAPLTSGMLDAIEAAIPSTAGLISAINVSAGLTSNNLSALTFSNGNGVSFGLTGSVITGTVATNYQSQGAYLTTAALSQDSSKYAGTNGAITGGSITVNTSGVSVNLPAYLTTAMASNRGSDFVQATAAFAGTNASGTIASDGISVSVGAGGGLTNIRVSAGTTSNLLSALTFKDTNGVSFGIDASTITATVKTDYLTSQSTQFLALTLGGNTAGTTTFHASNNASLFIHGGNNITVSGNGSSVTISGPNVGGAQTGISGVVVSDTTYTSGTVSFSNAGNITISSSVNGATQYIRLSGNAAQTNQSAIKAFGVSNTGQTAGNTGVSTGIDWVLAGSQSITLSQSTAAGGPNTVWLQHPAWLTTAMQSNAATISNINVSGGTTSSNLSAFKLIDSQGVSWSLDTGSKIYATVKTDYLTSQSTQFLAMTLGGNTAGTTTFNASNNASLFFHGGNNITLSGNGSSVTISGANVGGAQTGISGIVVSDTTYTSGTVSFSNQNNITIGSSVNGATQYIRLSVGNYITTAALSGDTSKYVQAWELTGNTAGTTSSLQGTKLYFEGGNSITVSGTSNTIKLSVGNYITTAMLSNAATISNINVSGGTTSSNLSAFKLIDSQGVSWSLDTGSKIYATVKTDYLTSQSTQFLALTLGGNTAGTTTFHASNNASLFLHGGNNITLSGNGSSVTISGAAGAQTGISGIVVSDTTYTSGTVSFSNQANITIGSSVNGATQYIRLSGNPAQTTQSAIKAFGVSNTGQTAGNTGVSTGIDWVLAGSQSITLSQSTAGGGPNTVWFQHPAWLTTAMQSNAATISNINISGGTTSSNLSAFKLIDSQGVSWSLDTGSKIYATVKTDYLTSQSTQFMALTLGGNTAGTTTFHATNNASIFLNGGNNITLSGNGSTVTISAANQSNQTLGLYAVGNTTGESSSSTFDARTVSFNGAGIASVGYSAGSVVISVPSGGGGLTNIRVSAGTTSNLLSAITFADSNGISFGINASTVTASANTVGTATTYYDVASANSVGTVTRWAAEDHKHAGIGAVGISTAGNTSGTTGSEQGTYWFQGGSNITLSQVTSNNGSHTLVISAPTPATMSMWPYPLPGSTAVSTYYSGSTSQGAGGGSTRTGYTFSLYCVPMELPAALAFSELRVGLSNTRSGAGTGSVTQMYSVGFYTNNASTLSLLKGYYGGLAFSQNSVTAQTFSIFTVTTANAQSGAGGGFSGIINAAGTIYSSQGNISANSQMDGTASPVKFIRIDNGVATTLTAGQYYMVFGNCTASSNSNIFSLAGVIQSNAISSVHLPDVGRENSTQTSNYLGAWGAISTTFSSNSNAAQWFPLPTAIAISDLSMSSGAWQRFHFPVMRNHS